MSECASNVNKSDKESAKAMMVQLTTDGVPKLHCPMCNRAMSSLSGYVKHVKKHDAPGGFFCRYCDARFCSDEELKQHRDKVHVTIACRICRDITFTNESDYRDHIRSVHNGIDREMYKCEKCGAEYKTADPFRRHIETQCGTIKPFKCDQCEMAFVTKYNLKQHKESHTGERKFCCSYCGKNFLQKGRLVEHERSHTGEKPYKCDVCGKCFAHRESIVTHSSIHTGIRLVECKCCSSRFSCYSNLIKHRRTRPDTCGLPEYDPPKNRVRTHRSRIPPTLNPTSEIKVCSLNRVIKHVDKEHRKKKGNEEKVLKSAKPKRVISTANNKAIAKRRKKLDQSSDGEEEEDDNDDDTNYEDSEEDSNQPITQRETRRTRASAMNAIPTPTRIDSDLDESFVEFDAGDVGTDEEEFHSNSIKAPIKGEKPETETRNDIDVRPPASFEYAQASHFVEAEFDMKREEDVNIFNEKDKLLDCLLNEEDEDQIPFVSADMSPAKSVKLEDDILEETEIVLIKNESDEVMQEEVEDIFNNKEINEGNSVKCKILLKDITMRYPKLKKDPTIRVGRNKTSGLRLPKIQPGAERERNASNRPVRKYRKRNGNDVRKDLAADGPKRVAKISQQELKERLKMLKRDERTWQCPHCIKIYHMRKPYEKHLRDDHRCPEEEIKEMFKSDELSEINEDVFKCHICDKIYLVEKRLLAHLKLHGPNGNLTFKCPCYCSRYFETKEAATAHAQKEHRDLIYCECCEKFMTGHDSLKNHMKNHHLERGPRNLKRNLVCDKCGKKFSGRTSLTDHVRSDCGRVPLYPCTVCGKHLTTAGILKTHMLLHKDETPYQCEQCGKTFKVKAQYKTHLKTRHTDYKPFKCHLCPKEYPYRESLLTHMTVHTGIKRFLCNGCGKRFTCISNLQAHRKVHADTCGQLPLNAKATQYMGVQKGNLLLGAKPEAGLDYNETNTLIAKDVLDRDLPMAQEINFPSEPSAPLATVPLNYTQPPPAPLMLPEMISHFIDDSPSASYT